jgi:hypothetical protein
MVLQKVKPADTLPTSATAAREEPGEEAPPPSAASETKDKSHVDNLLDEALSGNAKVGHAPPPAAEIPFTPSRDEVSAAMAVLLPAIRGCAMGQAGLATAGIVVQNDGRVASVSVTGAPFEGSASGRCMEGVVRRAHFPRFKQPSFRVQFPFAIQ